MKTLPFAVPLAVVLLVTTETVVAAGEPIRVDAVLVTLNEWVEVPARERGVISSIQVAEGQRVQPGDVLAQLDDADARLDKDRAQAVLEAARQQAKNDLKIQLAKKSVELADMEYQRGLDSLERFRDVISKEEIARRKLAVEKGRLEVAQATHELELAQFELRTAEVDAAIAARKVERNRIVAPLAGIVVQIGHRPGEWIEPGAPVLRIVGVDRFRVEGFVDASLIRRDIAGSPATLAVDLGNGEVVFPGTLRFVSPEINPVDGKVHVWAEIENRAGRLRPGLRGALIIMPETSP